MIKTGQTTINNWTNCIQVSNPQLSLTATADVGPRIISLSLTGKRNILYQNPEQIDSTGGTEWRAYGGHRFWIAPEDMTRTYFPDNRALSVEYQPSGVILTAPLEESTGFQKTIHLVMAADAAHVRLTHNLTNKSSQSQNAAAWALTVMDAGGTAILPHSPHADWPSKLTAQNTLSLWAYTTMSDPRWYWGDNYILLRQTGGQSKPQKIGMYNSEGWAAYLLEGMLFIKFFKVIPGGNHPDLNSNLEAWTNHEFLELETLSPLATVKPGQAISHVEDWFLLGDIPPVKNDEDVNRAILPLVQLCRKQLTIP
jgi:hypothetical protein